MIHMKNKLKHRVISFVLALLILMSMFPVTVFAKAGDQLTGDEKIAYDALVPYIKQIASGERSSTEITIGTASKNYPVDTAVTFHESYMDFDYSMLIQALLADYPYEMYWFGNFYAFNRGMFADKTLAYFMIKFGVATNYRGSTEYTVDPAKTAMPAQVTETARKVVAANADKSDYEKLIAYCDYICDAVSYNNAAAATGNFSTNSDPWQLIYVFDENKNTNVVCEGYAKAFKYLCDLSEFSDPTFACYTVTGYMSSPTNGGAHMWNIVTLGGKNYLIDVTNSEVGTVGQTGELFLAGSTQKIAGQFTAVDDKGNVIHLTRTGYQIICDSATQVNYYYDEDTTEIFGSDVLTLADKAYEVNKDAFNLSFASMTMANSLDMNFAFQKSHVADWTGHYALIKKTYADGHEDVIQKVPFAEWHSATIGGVAHYYVTFTGIAAKEMTDNIYVAIYNADGEAVSNVWKDSVRDQAMRNLARGDINPYEKTMVVDMLNYGAAAQEYFTYNEEDLATAKLSETQKEYATKTAKYENKVTDKDPHYYGANVLLESNIQLMMAFTGVDQSMYAEVTFTNHYNKPQTYTIAGKDFKKDGIYHIITIEEMVVADGRQEITCTVYNSDGEIVASATDSLESYVARITKKEDAKLYEMIMKFSDSAYAYFHPVA